MRCVTEVEIDEWLREGSIPKDPYRGDSAPAFYLQFHAPSTHHRLDALVRHCYERMIPESESLVHMTDWGGYEQSEMVAIAGIRSSCGEGRMLIDAPGHVLTSGEKDIGISLFSLSASFAWSSYLYSPQHRSTLYNWEGELFDFWTDSEQAMSGMKLVLERFDLAETSQARATVTAPAPPHPLTK